MGLSDERDKCGKLGTSLGCFLGRLAGYLDFAEFLELVSAL